MRRKEGMIRLLLGVAVGALIGSTSAQVPPTSQTTARYQGVLAAAAAGDTELIRKRIEEGGGVDVRDHYGRTPLHVAAYGGHHQVMRTLVELGADPNALERDAYDIVTIAAVANDLPTLNVALELGASAGSITSPYEGTALIAAAHLGHHEVVKTLIEADAPLDQVNNLGWTAVIESIVLGDGGGRHVITLSHLIEAGADINLPDRSGSTPLALAKRHGYSRMVELLVEAGAR